MVDGAYLYDNSEEDTNPLLLFQTTDGKLTKTYGEMNDWAKPVLANTINQQLNEQ